MSIAEVIKKKEKKRKKPPEKKPPLFESPLWKRVEEHAKDWDNRHTKEFTEKYRHLTQKPSKVEKQPQEEGPMEGKSAPKLQKPMEPDKPVEENPNYQTELKKEDQRNRKIKKTRKKKAEKPKSEFLEKYYGKDWA